MNRIQLIAAGLVSLVLLVFVVWLMTAGPSESEIESLRQPIAPLPELNLQTLASESFLDRQVYGPLPVDANATAIGRDDPFAGF